MIAVIDYGIGNLRSAEKALQRVGADARLVTDPMEIAQAQGVVLPGVGAFGPCAVALRESGLDRAALGAIERGIPFLGICIGLQLLYEGSEEDPGEAGLGVLPGMVRALPPGVKHPQMQWNVLDRTAGADSDLLAGTPEPAWVYFVHSFAPELTVHTTSTCDYGGPVTASIQRGSVWGTQFHPEKSGVVGLGILANFVHAAGEPVPVSGGATAPVRGS